MNPVTKAVLLSWNWRIDILLILLIAGTLYSRGWWRLYRRTQIRRGESSRSKRPLVVTWRLVSYWGGLFFIFLSLISPIDSLGEQLFLMHMIQHLLLIMFAPPLLLIANPMPFLLWGMPDRLRFATGSFLHWLLHKEAPFRKLLISVTSPGFLWLMWVVFLLGWHDAVLYDAALQYEWVHNLEHGTFFAASMLFWWNITTAGPRIHKKLSFLTRTALVMAAIPPNMGLGVVLSFAREPLYTYYLSVPRLWDIDVLMDQQIGGLIMWIPGSMMYLIAALILIGQFLSSGSSKKRQILVK